MWKGLEGQAYSWQHHMLLQDHQFLGMVLLPLAAPKAAHRNYQEGNKKREQVFDFNTLFVKQQDT